MKIRVKVVCTFLTLSKKPPPPFPNPGYAPGDHSGVFRGGGIVPCLPLFGVPVMHKYVRIVRKIKSFPPLEFVQKTGLNLSEGLLLLVIIILKFPAPLPPPFKNPTYASERPYLQHYLVSNSLRLSKGFFPALLHRKTF